MRRFHYSWFTKMFLWFGFVKNPLMWPGGYNMEIGVSPNPCTIKNTPLEALFMIYVISLVLLPGKYLTKSLQKVFTLFCAQLKCLDTCRHFSLSAHCRLLWDTQHDNTHKLASGKYRQTHRAFCCPTDKHLCTHTYMYTRTPYHSSRMWFWSCDKLSSQRRLSTECFSVLFFDAVLVINSDKSSGMSLLMWT